MKEVTSTSFGYLIAFLLPGMFGLYALSFWIPPIRDQLQPMLKADATVGPSVVLLLIALGMGLIISALRWVVFEKLCYWRHRISPEMYKDFEGDKMAAHRTLAEEHYRYHQFYGGCFISLLILFAGWARSNWHWDWQVLWVVVGFALLALLLERSSYDTWFKYTSKFKAIATGEEEIRGVSKK